MFIYYTPGELSFLILVTFFRIVMKSGKRAIISIEIQIALEADFCQVHGMVMLRIFPSGFASPWNTLERDAVTGKYCNTELMTKSWTAEGGTFVINIGAFRSLYSILNG